MARVTRSFALVAAACLLPACGSAEDLASSEPASAADARTDAELTSAGGVVVMGSDISQDAEETASPVEVVVYEDFQCPYCKQLEESAADFLEEKLVSGEITVEYRIVSFLDQASANKYSSRAANAALCVFDEAGPGAFHTFHATLFANQPEEGTAGPEDDQLAAYASEAGAEVDDCIADQAMADQVVESTQQMTGEGVTGTPTVLVDGETVDLTSETALPDAIEHAAG